MILGPVAPQTFEDLQPAMNDWATVVIERFPNPSGTAFAENSITSGRATMLSYWLLRDHRYGSFEPIFAPCSEGRGPSIYALVHNEHIMPDQAKDWLPKQPEQRMLAISELGFVALLTEHKHARFSRQFTITTGELALPAIVDVEAITAGYTPQEAFTEFRADLEAHNVLGGPIPSTGIARRAAGRLNFLRR